MIQSPEKDILSYIHHYTTIYAERSILLKDSSVLCGANVVSRPYRCDCGSAESRLQLVQVCGHRILDFDEVPQYTCNSTSLDWCFLPRSPSHCYIVFRSARSLLARHLDSSRQTSQYVCDPTTCIDIPQPRCTILTPADNFLPIWKQLYDVDCSLSISPVVPICFPPSKFYSHSLNK